MKTIYIYIFLYVFVCMCVYNKDNNDKEGIVISLDKQAKFLSIFKLIPDFS